MLVNPFDWRDWAEGKYPALSSHSQAKLKIISDYIHRYFEILCGYDFGQSAFKFTIVDGFSGGGRYAQDQLGSPLVIMRAVKAAEAALNVDRRIPLKLDVHFYFVDESKEAVACLLATLEQSEFKNQLGKTIHIRRAAFEKAHPAIVQEIKKRCPKRQRVLFLLDQCGFTEVSAQTIRAISQEFNGGAEYIINIAVEWFSDLLRDTKQFETSFRKLGISAETNFKRLVQLKHSGVADWRYLVEAELGPAYKRASASPYWSPFFIKSPESHRGYWLLHLSPHETARHAMSEVQWKHGNFLHFGRSGLSMLAYDPQSDIDRQGYIAGLSFDETMRKHSLAQLEEDYKKRLHEAYQDGISVGKLIAATCNETMAERKLMLGALSNAVATNDLRLFGPNGGRKRSTKVMLQDQVIPNRQRIFSF